MPGIVGLGRAADLAREHLAAGGTDQVARRRDVLEQGLLERVPGTRVNGTGARTPNTTNLLFEDLSAEALVMALAQEGVCASTGSACSSSRQKPSHVLLAMGLDPTRASSSVRFLPVPPDHGRRGRADPRGSPGRRVPPAVPGPGSGPLRGAPGAPAPKNSPPPAPPAR